MKAEHRITETPTYPRESIFIEPENEKEQEQIRRCFGVEGKRESEMAQANVRVCSYMHGYDLPQVAYAFISSDGFDRQDRFLKAKIEDLEKEVERLLKQVNHLKKELWPNQ